MAEAVAARSWRTELGGVGAMAHGEFVEETPLSPGIMKYTQCDLERTRFYWLFGLVGLSHLRLPLELGCDPDAPCTARLVPQNHGDW